jgi:hypothetical protein
MVGVRERDEPFGQAGCREGGLALAHRKDLVAHRVKDQQGAPELGDVLALAMAVEVVEELR